MSNLKHWIWLTLRKGLAGQNAVRILEHFGTPELVHAADEEAYRMVGHGDTLADEQVLGSSRRGAGRL